MAVGAVFALVGAAVIWAIAAPGDDSQNSRAATEAVDHLAGSSWRTFNVTAASSRSATLTINWTSTGPVTVSWYATTSCSTPPHTCAVNPPLDSWSGEKSGRWSASGASGTRYLLYVEAWPTTDNGTVNFTATFNERYRASDLSLPTLAFAVTLAGGALLAGMGAVAVYLGLFLPTGVYGPFDDPGDLVDEVPPTSPAPSSPEARNPPTRNSP